MCRLRSNFTSEKAGFSGSNTQKGGSCGPPFCRLQVTSSSRTGRPHSLISINYFSFDEPISGHGRSPSRAIAFQNISSRRWRKSLSQPARLNFPRKEPFDPSFCMALMAMWRRTARFCGPCPIRVRSPSSFMTTSRRQCKRFSIPQCRRTTWLSRSGGSARPSM